MQDDSLIELVASSDASLSVPQERARSLYPAATRMMNVDIEFPQNCVRRNAAQEHIQTSSASVSEAYLQKHHLHVHWVWFLGVLLLHCKLWRCWLVLRRRHWARWRHAGLRHHCFSQQNPRGPKAATFQTIQSTFKPPWR